MFVPTRQSTTKHGKKVLETLPVPRQTVPLFASSDAAGEDVRICERGKQIPITDIMDAFLASPHAPFPI